MKKSLIIGLALFSSWIVWGSELTESAIRGAAETWLSGNSVFKGERRVSVINRIKRESGTPLPLYGITLSPSGYLVLSGNTELPPVIAFSAEGRLPSMGMTDKTELTALLRNQGEAFQRILDKRPTREDGYAQTNQQKWERLLKRGTRGEPIEPPKIIVDNFVSSLWRQSNPFNLLCPSSLNSEGDKAVAGCVQITAAQLMRYYQWPPCGIGEVSHEVDTKEIRAVMRADLTIGYDWEAMTDSPESCREEDMNRGQYAVARLIADLGILFQAEYGMRVTGTTAYDMNRAMNLKLRYRRGDYTAQDLTAKIKADVYARHPAVACYTTANEGHAFLVSGYAQNDDDDFFYMNYGWGGEFNGWYRLSSGHEDTVVTYAVANLIPQLMPVFKRTEYERPESFTLEWDFPLHFEAERFRLYAQRGQQEMKVIRDDINGDARSIELTGQPYGEATFFLQAMYNGEWQEISDGIKVNVVGTPLPSPIVTAPFKRLTMNCGSMETFVLTTSLAVEKVFVTTSRPDIFPDGNMEVFGSGTRWVMSLTAAQGTSGTALIWILVRDSGGNEDLLELPVLVKGDGSLYWYTLLDAAVAEARATGKRILMVGGSDAYGYTDRFRFEQLEDKDNRKIVEKDFVLWYTNCYTETEWQKFLVEPISKTLPFVSVINPYELDRGLRGLNGSHSDSDVRTFLNYVPGGSLNVFPGVIRLTSGDAADFTLYINSDISWKIWTTPGEITLPEMEGDGNVRLAGQIGRNPQKNDREAIICVYNGEQLKSTVIEQPKCPPYLETEGTVSIENGKNVRSLWVSSNTTWVASCDAPWVTLSEEGGTGGAWLHLSVDANTSATMRSCTIHLMGEGLTAECTVRQFPQGSILLRETPGWVLAGISVELSAESKELLGALKPLAFDDASGTWVRRSDCSRCGSCCLVYVSEEFLAEHPDGHLYGKAVQPLPLDYPGEGWHLICVTADRTPMPSWASQAWAFEGKTYRLVPFEETLEMGRAYWIYSE